MLKTLKMDINSTCRLCLRSSEEFVCIFDEETFDILPEIHELLDIFQITVKCYVFHLKEIIFLNISFSNHFFTDYLTLQKIEYHVHEMLRQVIELQGVPQQM